MGRGGRRGGGHAIAVRVYVCSSPVTLAFESVVVINPLRRDTGPS